jgi:AAT family amino acid transporter
VTHNFEKQANEIECRDSEHTLQRKLTQRQLTMMVIGSAIGTGLFLGSGLAIHFGGPATILAYLFCSCLALMISWALAEMAMMHPDAGSLGIFAGRYISSWTGYMVMVSYWACAVISIGQEIVAASIYCQFWFKGIPQWFSVSLFAGMLIYINSWAVARFGEFEYWFAIVKVITIVLFIAFSGAMLLGLTSFASPGLSNYKGDSGFLPNGWSGLWFSVPFALVSFIGIELISVTAGEVKNPSETIRNASNSIIWRLIIFYVASIALLLAVVSWNDVGVRISPFVFVFQAVGIRSAAALMNFVVLTAALSGANASLYAATRMLYSLARDGLAPAVFQRVSGRGVPFPALLGSAVGLAIAIIVSVLIPAKAFGLMIAVAYFQIMFVWIAILVAYMVFRRVHNATPDRPRIVRGHPFTTVVAIGSLLAIVLTSWWIPSMKPTVVSGLIWLLLASGYYLAVPTKLRSQQKAQTAGGR